MVKETLMTFCEPLMEMSIDVTVDSTTSLLGEFDILNDIPNTELKDAAIYMSVNEKGNDIIMDDLLSLIGDDIESNVNERNFDSSCTDGDNLRYDECLDALFSSSDTT